MDVNELKRRLYFPPLGLDETNYNFMKHADCSSVDFQARKFVEICHEIGIHQPFYHRKLWEFVFIVHHLREKGMIWPGKRGIVFGVGTEPLPSLFARDGAEIMATDAPLDIIEGSSWSSTNQHADGLAAIFRSDIISWEKFSQQVSHAYCDMNNIPSLFRDFDFCWSSCCFEHLGSLQLGMDFVISSVEKTLKIGGVACHTTEFNLSSDSDTLESGPTVIYRRKDIKLLAEMLRDRGHHVDEVVFSNNQNAVDTFVDLPPYLDGFPHVRLELDKYVVTSVGLVVTRGR